MNITPQLGEQTFPTLYAMAMDYLLIHTLSVLCERVFSSSSETDTNKRNCINGLLMETLQMLKFGLKRDHLSVNEHFPNMVEKDMNYDDLTLVYTPDTLPTDILTKMQNILDRVIAATEPRVAVDIPPTEEIVTEE